MPYRNFPKSIPQSKIEKCVNDVMGKGHSKPSAIAICYTSMVKGKELDATMKSFELKAAPKYRKCEKSITDAPNLRSEDAQACYNCKYYQLVESPSTVMMMNDTPDGEGVCTQYEFLTKADWVCDGWEEIPLPAEMEMKEFSVIKQTDGHYRWTAFTSSSYLDRDREIISQKALEEDTARMNAAKEYGVLDWWHTPVRLGSCDFSAMHGRISIESGLFDDDWMGAQFAKRAKELGASRTFFHPKDEPGNDKVYHHIKTFKRALLPRGKESNLLTMLYVSKEEKEMLADKIKELKKLFGDNQEASQKVDALLAVAEQTDKAAELAGLTSKEKIESPQEKPEAKPEGGDPKSKEGSWFVADMTPEEFTQKVTKAMSDSQMGMMEKIQGMMKEMQGMMEKMMSNASAKSAQEFAQITAAQSDLDRRLAVLEGLKPRAYQASQALDNLVSKETVKEKTPKGDKQAEDSLTAWLAS